MNITVVGLLPGQANAIKRDFPGHQFQFLLTKSHPVAPRCEECFLMTRFLSHNWYDKITSSVPRNKVHCIVGGMGELKRKLSELKETPSCT